MNIPLLNRASCKRKRSGISASAGPDAELEGLRSSIEKLERLLAAVEVPPHTGETASESPPPASEPPGHEAL